MRSWMRAIGSAVAVAILCSACATTAGLGVGGGRWVDLTHAFGEDTLYWPTAERFTLVTEFRGVNAKGYFYASSRYGASEHGGTHLDAPIHFNDKGSTADAIPIERLIGEARVVDVVAACEKDPDYQVSREDILAHEARFGRIPDDALLFIKTGFSARWPDAVRYLGTAERGPDAVAKLHFPGLHPDAASWITAERRVKAVGIDTASIDFGQSTYFMSHRILYAADIPAFENVAALEVLPSAGARVVALPMKIRGGTGGPLRIVAWIPADARN